MDKVPLGGTRNVTIDDAAVHNVDGDIFPDLQSRMPNGQLNFDMHTCTIEMIGTKEFVIKFKGNKTKFYFYSPYENQVKIWFYEIQKVLRESSKIENKQLPPLLFSKFEEISEKAFLNSVETGDMLLFKYNNIAGTLQSVVTGGHFNHVAFCVKGKTKGDVMFVEAVSSGVSCSWWSDTRMLMGPGKPYEKVCFRKLNTKRDYGFHQKINDFVEESEGLQYSLKNSVNPTRSRQVDPSSGMKYVEPDRKFFCSEHVAKAYKILGVFDTDLPSGKFWPNTLEKDNLPLADGSSLGKIVNIVPKYDKI